MKSAGQLFLGLLAAIGTGLLVFSAASLALIEGGTPVAVVESVTPVLATATQGIVSVLTNTPNPTTAATATATQAQPTECPAPEGWKPYVIQPGDTLEAIAERSGTSVEEIQQANCLQGTSLIPGSILQIPAVDLAPATSTSIPTLLPTLPPTAVIIPCGPPPGWVIYIVQRGDTLYRLSIAFGVTQTMLMNANCMVSTYLIAGQTLYVPNIATRTPVITKTPKPTATLTPVPIEPTATSTPVTPSPVPPTNTPVTPTVVVPTDNPTPTDTPSGPTGGGTTAKTGIPASIIR